jgi:hypothetical protein
MKTSTNIPSADADIHTKNKGATIAILLKFRYSFLLLERNAYSSFYFILEEFA